MLFISQFINIPEKHTEQYFDMDYNYLAILDEHPEETKIVEKTKNFEKMKEIAETLSITIVSEIVGVMGVYMIKSYLETKEEKRMEYENRILDEDNTGE